MSPQTWTLLDWFSGWILIGLGVAVVFGVITGRMKRDQERKP